MAEAKRKTLFKLPIGANLVDLANAKGAVPISKEEVRRRAQAHASLNVQVGPSATKGYTLDQDFDGARLQLPVMSIHLYDNNPRSVANPRFAEIKESIRESLIKNPLIVTKRPGTREYMLCDGGNTRLAAIQELWQETKDAKFEITPCLYREWKSESHVLVGHLIENEVRGDMTFWDKARGIVTLKDKLEHEEETILTLQATELRLREIGLPTGKSTISLYSFAVERLGDAGPYLTFPSARNLQSHLTSARKSLSRLGIDEQAYWLVISDALSSYVRGFLSASITSSDDNPRESSPFSANDAINACDEALAGKLGRPLDEFKALCSAAEKNPDASSSELHFLATATKSAATIEAAPTSAPSNGVPLSAIAPNARAGVVVNGDGLAYSEALDNGEQHGLVGGGVSDNPLSVGAVPSRLSVPSSNKAQALPLPEQISAKQKVFMAAVETLARDAKVLMCLRSHHTLPMGFYMEFPAQSIEFSDDANPYSIRPTVWWFLASLSGQREHEVIKQFIPANSKWRLTYEEAPPMQLGEQEIQVNQLIGTNADLIDLKFLFAPTNPMSRQMAEVMIAHAELTALRAQLADASVSAQQESAT